jgi:uncharacterized RmlC-like cupin family protein
MSGGVRRVAPDERIEGAATSGMTREEAVATDGMWAGFVRTAPGMVSGWHHHAAYETAIYVISGALRMEFGPHGAETLKVVQETSCTWPRVPCTARATPATRSPKSWSSVQGPERPSSTSMDHQLRSGGGVGPQDYPTRLSRPLTARAVSGDPTSS